MKEKARAFAIERHGDQRYGSHPYSFHLENVANIVSEYGSEAVVVACLHDIVEDTNTTLEEIESTFGLFVSQCVAILTDEPGVNRKERNRETYKKMAKVSGKLELALIVKAADRLANFRACVAQDNEGLLSMYKKEHSVFKQSVYRPSLCEPFWQEMEVIVNT